MLHIRTFPADFNRSLTFACGVSPLPEGDQWVYEDETHLHRLVDCPDCGAGEDEPFVRASSMNGNAAQRHLNPEAWDRWCDFTESWGGF